MPRDRKTVEKELEQLKAKRKDIETRLNDVIEMSGGQDVPGSVAVFEKQLREADDTIAKVEQELEGIITAEKSAEIDEAVTTLEENAKRFDELRRAGQLRTTPATARRAYAAAAAERNYRRLLDTND